MNIYDFKTLSPYEFEILTQDLLQKEFNLTLEGFKPGPDQGIDLRYSRNNINDLIVQCKHFAGSSFSDLKKELKKDSVKIQKLNPTKYKIVTSYKLTPLQKTKIQTLFSLEIVDINDIYGSEDLNNLLRKFPEVERAHFKLWLSSTSVLKCLLHSDVYNKSAYTIEKIKQKIKLFVPNDSLFEAFNILNKHNYVVISGAPGVGKTTLAEMLILSHIEQGYELIEVSEDIKSAWDCCEEDKKQIFYFDDFLGQTALQKSLNKNEDARLIDFIEKTFHSKNKKFILTTREYILNEAKLNYEKLANYEFEQCVIDLKKYTDKIKAHILYNHLFFSGLDIKYFENLLEDNKYFNIIRHKNYNPRIIEYMTKSRHIPSNDYYFTFMDNLNNPFKIWEIAFKNHLDDISKSILLSILACGNWVSYQESKNTAQIIYEKLFFKQPFNNIQYDDSLKILNGDWIILNKHFIDFANPSIKDFLENYILKNKLLYDIVLNLYSFKQLKWFYNCYIYQDKKISKNIKLAFLDSLFSVNLSANYMSEVIECLCIILDTISSIADKTKINLIKNYLDYIITRAQVEKLHVSTYEEVIDKCGQEFFKESDLIITFLKRLKNFFVEKKEDLGSYSDYYILSIFIEKFNDIFSGEEIVDLQSDFEENYEYILDTSLNGCSSSYQIEELIEKMEETEGLFVYKDLDEAYERLEDYKNKEMDDNDDSESANWGNLSSASKNELNKDEEIKIMFESLKNRN